MSTLSLLTDIELDTVTGGSFSINLVGISFQTNASATNQGQVNASFLALASNQGGGQAAITAQSNSIG